MREKVSLQNALMPLDDIELLGEEMIYVVGGNIPPPSPGTGCGCGCTTGAGCGCGCTNGVGCGCGCA